MNELRKLNTDLMNQVAMDAIRHRAEIADLKLDHEDEIARLNARNKELEDKLDDYEE